METRTDSPEPEQKNAEKTRVLSRSYDILMALNNHPDGLSLREICLYVKLPRSTVRRILDTLEEQNIVITASSTSLYRLGPTLALFASNIRPFDITKIARPMLMQLADKTGENVNLCVVAHGMAVVVDQIIGIYPLHTVTTIGTSIALHATASGKALLATLSEKELEALRLQIKLAPLTQNTMTDWDRLLLEIETIRATGVAIDREEHQVGVNGIAIPIKSPGGENGAIGIAMPTHRFQARERELIERLLQDTQDLHWKP